MRSLSLIFILLTSLNSFATKPVLPLMQDVSELYNKSCFDREFCTVLASERIKAAQRLIYTLDQYSKPYKTDNSLVIKVTWLLAKKVCNSEWKQITSHDEDNSFLIQLSLVENKLIRRLTKMQQDFGVIKNKIHTCNRKIDIDYRIRY